MRLILAFGDADVAERGVLLPLRGVPGTLPDRSMSAKSVALATSSSSRNNSKDADSGLGLSGSLKMPAERRHKITKYQRQLKQKLRQRKLDF